MTTAVAPFPSTKLGGLQAADPWSVKIANVPVIHEIAGSRSANVGKESIVT